MFLHSQGLLEVFDDRWKVYYVLEFIKSSIASFVLIILGIAGFCVFS